ncbi:MAG: hypothetical protein FWC58_03825 [Desulfobulbus sp.]|nr:hypothetical protein [Desulfobulbus sp.]
MKWLLSILLFAAVDYSFAEPALSADNKAHLLKIMSEALRDRVITEQEYEQSISWVNSAPCAGVDRGLTTRRKAQLEAAIARQQKLEKVTVYKSFKRDGWSIVFSDASVGDSPYFFYSTDPVKGAKPLAVWSGAATILETSEIADWVKINAPGIPERLADCFAWHVTLSSE